jgi:sulfite reductase alpha subunit-like flavoprotein
MNFSFLTKKNITIYIFYGSQTGYAESVAKNLHEQIKTIIKPIFLEISPLNNLFTYNIQKEDFVIILLSTTGDGEFPDNAINIYKYLRKFKGTIENISYTLFGFGDSNYRSYCHSSKILERRLKRFKATQFMPTTFNDEATNGTDVINKWIEDIINYFKNHKVTLMSWFLKSIT